MWWDAWSFEGGVGDWTIDVSVSVFAICGHGERGDCSLRRSTIMDGPPRIQPKSLSEYLEVMSQTVFWVGISWRVVESKWSGIHDAFQGFDPVAVANLSPDEIDRLASDRRVIRHRGKLDAIVYNAGRLLELDEQHGSFDGYLRSYDETSESVADVRDHFKYLGQMSAYQFLYSVSVIDDDGTISKD